jgi:hypothetical protein
MIDVQPFDDGIQVGCVYFSLEEIRIVHDELQEGIVVGIPSTMNSSRARRILAMASQRSLP